MSNIITAGNATNNGTSISSDTSGVLELKTGSTPTTALTIDASQNVGIGTVSPIGKLTAIGSAAASAVNFDFGNSAAQAVSDAVTLRFLTSTAFVSAPTAAPYISAIQTNASTSNTDIAFGTFNGSSLGERMRIDSSGNVGIGTASPGANLDVRATTGPQVRIAPVTGTSYGFLSIGNTGGNFNIGRESSGGGSLLTGSTGYASVLNSFGAYPMQFGTNGTLAMTIDSSGNLLVGTTTSYGKLTVASSSSPASAIWNSGGTSGFFGQVSFRNNAGSGEVGSIVRVNDSSIQYNTSSDYRLKEDIAPMTGALDKVSTLKPVTYKWKSDGSDGQGFIAHELAEVCPDAVQGTKDAVDAEGNPVYQGIDTSFLVATLTAAIQELKAELDATKAEVAALKGA
jgi:hypothetical protein